MILLIRVQLNGPATHFTRSPNGELDKTLTYPLLSAGRNHKKVFETCLKAAQPDGVTISLLNVPNRLSIDIEDQKELCVGTLNQAA